jgi:superfamily I DNA/RNA helicase
MQQFAGDYDADVRVLEQSYRLPPSVHAFVHEYILGEFSRRQEKLFRPRSGGVDLGLTRCGSFNDVDPAEIGAHETLVLVRDRFRMLDAKKVLNAHTIPYRVAGGSSPFDNVKANAIRGMIKLNMGDTATERELRSLGIALQDSNILKGDYSRVMGKDWKDAITLTETQYDFYTSIDLFIPINVTLSTIHQAKGREADRVYVDLELTPRVTENISRNRDSELRVMYVACTRAREGLNLCAENALI